MCNMFFLFWTSDSLFSKSFCMYSVYRCKNVSFNIKTRIICICVHAWSYDKLIIIHWILQIWQLNKDCEIICSTFVMHNAKLQCVFVLCLDIEFMKLVLFYTTIELEKLHECSLWLYKGFILNPFFYKQFRL